MRRASINFAVLLLLAAGLTPASAQRQITEYAIAVDASGAVYTGGERATVTRAGAWSIELGPNGAGTVRALAAGRDGSIYAAGQLGGGGFVARITPEGKRIGWRNLESLALAVAIDDTGSVYVGGRDFLARLDSELSGAETLSSRDNDQCARPASRQ